MKNTECTIINVYTQENGEKIAISMLHTYKGYYGTVKPTAEIEKYGKIEGEINSYWGKLPVVLVPVEQFAALKKEYDVIDFRGPVDRTRIRESKPRPDAMALKLYKVFAADAAAPQVDADGYPVEITVDGYSFKSGNGENLLKALKREYNFTKADIAAAFAMVIDAAADDAEQPAAPVVEDIAADDAEQPAAPVVEDIAADDAEQPAAPVVEDIAAAVDAHFADMIANAPADDAAAPSSEKTETTPANQKTAKQIEDERIEKVIADYECGIYPCWYVKNLHCESSYFFNCDVISWGKKQIKVKNLETGKNKIFNYDWFIRVVEYGSYIVSMPYDAEYMAILKHKQQQPAAVTDADALAAAARIKSNYESMMQQAAADAAPAPRRRRLNIAPRLLRRLRPVRWVAVAFVVCLLSGLLLGMNTSNAAAVDADTDDIVAVYELAPVTITAAAVTDAPAADAVTPSSEKTVSDIAAVTDAPAAADAVTPSSEKTVSDIAAVTDAPADADTDGLTICAGTAWAYTMMIWA